MGVHGRHGAAGRARVSDRRRSIPCGRLDAARTVRRPIAAAAGGRQSRGGRARSAGGARTGRTAARPADWQCAPGDRRQSDHSIARSFGTRAAGSGSARRAVQERVHAIHAATGRNPMSITCSRKDRFRRADGPRFTRALSAACVASLALLTIACSEGANGATPPPEPLAVQIGAENVVAVESGTIVVGPIISGELTPTREATVRAELGGAILDVSVEEAQAVARGALLARIETRTLEDARQSAASSVRSAENQLAVARRETERTEMLVEAGALAARELDIARNTVASAEAALADARSRLAGAERSLGDTVVHAPFNGIVASRAAHTGDIVTPGAEMFHIIDPSSMRLEASVPSEDLSVLRVGASVEFTVRGYDRTFNGRIERIAPQADPTTRRVPIYVAIPNVGGKLVAGLFAEGRVVSDSASGLIVPLNAVNTTEAEPWVLRVRDGVTERVPIMVGLRDPRREEVQVASGLNAGDTLLRGAAQGISPGTPVKLTATR